MNYRAAIAELRSARNQEEVVILRDAFARAQEVRARYRREMDSLIADRNALIYHLRADGKSQRAIAAEVGCSEGMVYEVLNPARREAYNRRRRKHWHAYAERAA